MVAIDDELFQINRRKEKKDLRELIEVFDENPQRQFLVDNSEFMILMTNE